MQNCLILHVIVDCEAAQHVQTQVLQTCAKCFCSASTLLAGSVTSNSRGFSGGKLGVAPVSMNRPRLQLKPRSKPLPDGGDVQPAADVVAQRRPRLHLQPRSKPLTDRPERQSNIFGATRPREEVLKVCMGLLPTSACPATPF